MKIIQREPSIEDLRCKQKDKANTVFIKLLAKNRRKANPWGVVRSETYILSDNQIKGLNKLGAELPWII